MREAFSQVIDLSVLYEKDMKRRRQRTLKRQIAKNSVSVSAVGSGPELDGYEYDSHPPINSPVRRPPSPVRRLPSATRKSDLGGRIFAEPCNQYAGYLKRNPDLVVSLFSSEIPRRHPTAWILPQHRMNEAELVLTVRILCVSLQ